MQHSIGNVAVEVAVIVFSILAAFALDSWWEGAGERRVLELELTSIREEMLANHEHLSIWRDVHARIVSSVDAVLAVADTNSEIGEAAVYDSLLAGTSLTPTTNPSSGAVQLVINSGRLALLESIELRLALSGWEDAVKDVSEDETAAYAYQIEHGLAWMQANWSSEVYQRNRSINSLLWRSFGEGEALPNTESVIPLPDAYRNLLNTRRSFADASVLEIGNLMERVERILALLEQELDR